MYEEYKKAFSVLSDSITEALISNNVFNSISNKDVFQKINQSKMWLVISPYQDDDAYTFSYTMNSPDSVRWMFTPDWNIDSRLSKRKQPFNKYGNAILGDVALSMEVPQRQLSCTSQKWKGFTYKIKSSPDEWTKQQTINDYVEKSLNFVTSLRPYVEKWLNEQKSN